MSTSRSATPPPKSTDAKENSEPTGSKSDANQDLQPKEKVDKPKPMLVRQEAIESPRGGQSITDNEGSFDSPSVLNRNIDSEDVSEESEIDISWITVLDSDDEDKEVFTRTSSRNE